MRRPVSMSLVLSAAILASLAFESISAAAEEAPVALAPMTVQQEFANCGFMVTDPGSPPNARLIVVRDARSDTDNLRILTAIVYPDVDAALSAHEQAHSFAERHAQVDVPLNDDNGPQLLPGYGGTVWRNNVALMESNAQTLNSLYTWDPMTDETRLANPQAFDLGFRLNPTGLAVDRHFVDCVEHALATPQIAAGHTAESDTGT
jgi:hypothetical protein